MCIASPATSMCIASVLPCLHVHGLTLTLYAHACLPSPPPLQLKPLLDLARSRAAQSRRSLGSSSAAQLGTELRRLSDGSQSSLGSQSLAGGAGSGSVGERSVGYAGRDRKEQAHIMVCVWGGGAGAGIEPCMWG